MMRATLIAMAAALPILLMADTRKAPVQPIPFSHKRHSEASIRCNVCHPNAARAERAGLPGTAQCMACHAAVKQDSPHIRELAALHKQEKQIPWARIYQLPDFVFFSHEAHLKRKISCADCHGRVEQQDALAAEVTHDMKTCMACHSARGASNKCHVCHELGQ